MHYLRLAPFTFLLYACNSLGLTLPIRRALQCNGYEELCDRPYGNTTFLGSHDSFAFSRSPYALSRTQEVDIPYQLKLGVRMLQAQGHMNNNKLHFCHTTCGLFDGGSVEDYLKKVKTFLDDNPEEVLTFLFTNPEKVSVSAQWKPAFVNSGISKYLYSPPKLLMKREDWPTLGDMIQSGKRVVVFLDKGAESDRGAGGFILPEFNMLWEDPFSSTDDQFPCHVDRTAGPLGAAEQLNLINHNLNAMIFPGILMSDPLDAPKTNGVESILAHANGCAPYARGRAPNFVMIDYVNLGEGLRAVKRLNGFTK